MNKQHPRELTANGSERPGRADKNLPAILTELDQRRRALEAACNPEGENLHFGAEVRINSVALAALYEIGLQAWQAVENAQSWEASFWFYDWFLLVASVSLQVWRDHAQHEYSEALASRVALLLVEISQMTMRKEYEGDIQKRLFEATVHVLLAFGQSHSLWEVVTTRAQQTGNEWGIGFVRGASQAAQKIDREARK